MLMHNGILFNCTEDEIMVLVEKCMQLSQYVKQNDSDSETHIPHIFPHTQNTNLKLYMCLYVYVCVYIMKIERGP